MLETFQNLGSGEGASGVKKKVNFKKNFYIIISKVIFISHFKKSVFFLCDFRRLRVLGNVGKALERDQVHLGEGSKLWNFKIQSSNSKCHKFSRHSRHFLSWLPQVTLTDNCWKLTLSQKGFSPILGVNIQNSFVQSKKFSISAFCKNTKFWTSP